MTKNKKSRPVLAHHGGKGKTFTTILHHAPDFVQWLTGAAGCCLVWCHGIYWAIRLPVFDPWAFFCGVLLVAAAAVMEIKEGLD